MVGAPGGFALVVGPSGAGNDMAIAGARARLAGDARFVLPRPLVTRPPSGHEDNAEISEDAFARGAEAGGTLPGVHVVAVTAAPAILAKRLVARGRPQDGDLAARSSRAVPADADDTVANDGARAITVSRFVAILLERAGGRR